MFSYTPVPVEEEVACPEGSTDEHCYDRIPPVRDISFSYTSACAVTLDGYVYCWGENMDGEGGQGEPVLADGSNSRLNVARKVVNTAERSYENPYLNNIKQVVHGQKFACALSNDGEVFCWGINGSMQLGSYNESELLDTPWQSPDGNQTLGEVDALGKPIVEARKYSPTPLKVTFPSEVATVKKLFVGYDITCATVERNDNDPHNVYCWGNDSGLLITNNTDNYDKYYENANNAGYFKAQIGSQYSSNPYFEIEQDGVFNYTLSESEIDCLYVENNYHFYRDMATLTYCEKNFYDISPFYKGVLVIDDTVASLDNAYDYSLTEDSWCVLGPTDFDLNSKPTYSFTWISGNAVEKCVGAAQYRRYHMPYLLQKGTNSHIIFPMKFAAVEPTNNPTFENASDIAIGGSNLAKQICAVVSNGETTRVQCIGN